jgi:two-component system, LytTR family, sensor histidine kinase AlgZ
VRARLALLHDVQGEFTAGVQDGLYQVRITLPLPDLKPRASVPGRPRDQRTGSPNRRSDNPRRSAIAPEAHLPTDHEYPHR